MSADYIQKSWTEGRGSNGGGSWESERDISVAEAEEADLAETLMHANPLQSW